MDKHMPVSLCFLPLGGHQVLQPFPFFVLTETCSISPFIPDPWGHVQPGFSLC